ncbi:helicase, type I site-specific restriction-modification system restriction subunit [Deinococcus peraridilitoris]|uniref:Helicase, type I site-specific restriction-modification system restriction subunit n=1 Tax=Deinococcus peraridilitoris (strain DSM 19664 / LMG 22246 / CIP 109416 / KR-200) TaxID=937777 RepID=L0A5V5_DEIPD|nr:helicase, type I site-specific restriction-modification system restriction subunit [Deinococcus peraridilitoris]AFZ69263.1 helicase, type I site-specific restriction-modification system restriction subunit [Deinococcus peraridilitoris DSM 19664]
MLLATIQAQHVSHRKLAQHLPGHAQPESKEKRVARFFASEALTQTEVAQLILSLVGSKRVTLIMDRTNWRFGQCEHNILVIAVLYAGYAIPLVWDLLEHGGASSTSTRIALLDRLLQFVPRKRVRVFLADREFVGAQWFAALKKRRIRRCIRIRDDTLLDDVPVREAFTDLKQGQLRGVVEREPVYGTPMQVVATLSPAGERVVIASDLSLFDTLAEYRKRFSIECTFVRFTQLLVQKELPKQTVLQPAVRRANSHGDKLPSEL